ncbi:MAG: phosphatidate cytidylyltransferase [Deltaproteobacteria bacterium]|nr:phosphatidate cytidylyltransferase [Deltaproteobacteria bacterium]
MKDANRNLIVRIASAALLTPPLVLSVFWSRPEGIALWVLLAIVIGQGEFYWIALKEDPPWLRVVGVFWGVVLGAALYFDPFTNAALVTLIVATLSLAILQLFFHSELSRATAQLGVMLFGLLYVPLLITPLALLKRLPHGAEWIILVFCVTWFADTGAYAAGRTFGRHKLYPKISPGKTIEGALGGVLAAVGAAALAHFWYLPELTWTHGLLIAIPGSLLGMVGDLVESMIKRGYGAKDSGRAIPGHGGLLDRIDALLFVVPYVYLYVNYVVIR